MLRLTSLRSAGAAAVLSVAVAGLAVAADMPHPPGPVIHAPPPVLDVGGGFYLRGDVGIAYNTYRGLDFSPTLANSRTISNSLDASPYIGVGAGYQFNSWLRADVTLEYRAPAKFRIFEETLQGAPPGATPSGYNLMRGNISSMVALANGYVDLGTWHRITPFVGFGVGAASITTSDVTDAGLGAFAGGAGRAPDRTKTNFAWALHAGLGYDLSANWKAEAAYRYLNLGKVNTGTVACTVPCAPFNGRIKTLDSHEIRAGLRYVFADTAIAPIMPGPLVRKY